MRLPATEARSAAAPPSGDLFDRLAVSIVLIPAALLVIDIGGWPYALIVAALLGVAGREYTRLFAHTHYRPAKPLVLAGVALLALSAHFSALSPAHLLPALLIAAALIWHLVDYERGAPASGTDFVVTLGGIFYLGWLGRYFILLRAEPAGLWWLVAALTSMWLADTGAYLFGRLFGRRLIPRPMAPRLSPRKTWEGYAGSVLWGGLAGAGLGVLWGLGAGPAGLLTWQTGGVLGLLVGALGPFGDLGVSMIKRQSGVKDAGALIAGHGGALDRIDSWLVAVPLGYYFLLLVRALAGG
ncbi:MAG: phosphatidate cytidylyltransferase [Anaerolineales bacterium]|nr:phosphatidate cytidylyltransferase [Anaerolineales bacterium]